MKRLTAIVVVTAMFFASMTAFAEDNVKVTIGYTGGDENAAIVNGINDFSTVYITDSEGEIVYVNQVDSSFTDATMDFLIRSNPDVGEYTAKFGNASGGYTEKKFYIGVKSNNTEDDPMTRIAYTVEDNGTYTAGFYKTVSVSEYAAYNSLKIGIDRDGSSPYYGGFPLKSGNYPPLITGEGGLTLIFELDDIKASELVSVSAFLSRDTISSNNDTVYVE